MTTIALPVPSVRNGDRRATLTYVLAEVDETTSRALQVTVAHSKERKEFGAVVTPVTIRSERGYSMTSFWLYSGLRLSREATPRYSARAFDAFVAKAKAEFEDAYTLGMLDDVVQAALTDIAT